MTDPALDQQTQDTLDLCRPLFEAFYAKFTHNRVEYMERMKDDDSFRFVFDEDLQYLTKEYYEVYSDSDTLLAMAPTIAKDVLALIAELREGLRALPFDFHSCFYYDTDKGQF